MPRTKPHYGIHVVDLIAAGLLRAGEEVICEPRKGEVYRGIIEANGNILFSGRSYSSPSAAAAALAGNSRDGWDDIAVRGQPLKHYRSAYLGSLVRQPATVPVSPPPAPVTNTEQHSEFYPLIEQLNSLMADADEARRQTEADTRANFIDRYLSLLGYGLGDIRREYHVKDLREYIDYLLYVDGAKSVAVEAKALAVDLTDAMGAQVLKYAAIEDIDWCVLTNGRQFIVYDQHSRGSVPDKVVLQIDLSACRDRYDIGSSLAKLWMLSKESMRQGQLAAHVGELRIGRAIRDVLLDPASASARSIRSEVKRRFGLDVRQDQVAAWLHEKLSGR